MSGPNAVSVRWSISNNPKKDGCQGAFTGLIGYTLVIPPGKDLVYAISANRNGNISGIPTVPQKGVPIQIVNNNTDCIIKTTIDWTDKVTKKNFTQTYTSTWNCPNEAASGNQGTVKASVTGGNVIQQ